MLLNGFILAVLIVALSGASVASGVILKPEKAEKAILSVLQFNKTLESIFIANREDSALVGPLTPLVSLKGLCQIVTLFPPNNPEMILKSLVNDYNVLVKYGNAYSNFLRQLILRNQPYTTELLRLLMHLPGSINRATSDLQDLFICSGVKLQSYDNTAYTNIQDKSVRDILIPLSARGVIILAKLCKLTPSCSDIC